MKHLAVLLVLVAASQMRAGDSTRRMVREAFATGYHCGGLALAHDFPGVVDAGTKFQADAQWIQFRCDDVRKIYGGVFTKEGK